MIANNKTEIFKKLARIREIYTDAKDIKRIDEDEAKIKSLFKKIELLDNPLVEELISIAKEDIKIAKRRLMSDKSIVGDEKIQRELWFIIEAREWFIDKFSSAEEILENMESELDRELM